MAIVKEKEQCTRPLDHIGRHLPDLRGLRLFLSSINIQTYTLPTIFFNNEMSSILNHSPESSPLGDPRAWSFVMKWAEGSIEFPQLIDSMTQTFGRRYVSDEWKELYDRIFLFADPGEDIDDAERVRLSRAAVEAGMASRGISTADAGSSVSPATVPAMADRKGKGKRKASESPRQSRCRKRTRSTFVDRFLDIEAEDDGDDDEHPDVDGEDTDAAPRHHGIPATRVYLQCQAAGPSRYQQAVDTIAHRYLPSVLDGLDNDEYDRQHDEFYGIHPNDDDGDVEHEESGNTKIIDFQYDFNPKIQYWEDFMSQLTIIDDLEKRVALFRSISLSDHLTRLADYQSAAEVRSNVSHGVPSPTPEPPVLHVREEMGMWSVNINPHSSVAYIVNCLEERVNMEYNAQCARSLPQCLPPSGSSVPPLGVSKEPTPPVPGWYSVLKYGIYKGDIGYALSFDKDANELNLRSRPSDTLGQDPNASRLFSPELHHGRLRSPYRGLTCYQHSTDIFISGLLLLKLRPNQFKYLPAPFPSQICLHVASMVDPDFMKATHAKFNRLFWKPDDRVAISDPSHGEKWGNLVSIDLENESAV
ncbi:hypothetical protein HD554DRAFT_2041858, partial [Boletus coccyginus]